MRVSKKTRKAKLVFMGTSTKHHASRPVENSVDKWLKRGVKRCLPVEKTGAILGHMFSTPLVHGFPPL